MTKATPAIELHDCIGLLLFASIAINLGYSHEATSNAGLLAGCHGRAFSGTATLIEWLLFPYAR